jgi:hypothetical protein
MRHDRTVHARLADGREVVRYDRAGKWYIEADNSLPTRRHITIGQAVRFALLPGSTAYLGRGGGGRFDHAYAKQHPLNAS